MITTRLTYENVLKYMLFQSRNSKINIILVQQLNVKASSNDMLPMYQQY